MTQLVFEDFFSQLCVGLMQLSPSALMPVMSTNAYEDKEVRVGPLYLSKCANYMWMMRRITTRGYLIALRDKNEYDFYSHVFFY